MKYINIETRLVNNDWLKVIRCPRIELLRDVDMCYLCDYKLPGYNIHTIPCNWPQLPLRGA